MSNKTAAILAWKNPNTASFGIQTSKTFSTNLNSFPFLNEILRNAKERVNATDVQEIIIDDVTGNHFEEIQDLNEKLKKGKWVDRVRLNFNVTTFHLPFIIDANEELWNKDKTLNTETFGSQLEIKVNSLMEKLSVQVFNWSAWFVGLKQICDDGTETPEYGWVQRATYTDPDHKFLIGKKSRIWGSVINFDGSGWNPTFSFDSLTFLDRILDMNANGDYRVYASVNAFNQFKKVLIKEGRYDNVAYDAKNLELSTGVEVIKYRNVPVILDRNITQWEAFLVDMKDIRFEYVNMMNLNKNSEKQEIMPLKVTKKHVEFVDSSSSNDLVNTWIYIKETTEPTSLGLSFSLLITWGLRADQPNKHVYMKNIPAA